MLILKIELWIWLLKKLEHLCKPSKSQFRQFAIFIGKDLWNAQTLQNFVWQYVNEMVWINDLKKTCFSYDTTINIRNLKAQFNDCVKGLPDIPLCGKREIVDHLNNSTSKCKSNYQCYFRRNKISDVTKSLCLVKTSRLH